MKHQDIGQMQMYVNYYDRKIKSEEENKTIGIILCRDKSKAILEMTLQQYIHFLKIKSTPQKSAKLTDGVSFIICLFL